MDHNTETDSEDAAGRRSCPVCGSEKIGTSVETDRFAYGTGPDAPQVTVQVPVRTCADCGFQFTDEEAEEARHEAVCRQLGVLPPSQIRELRKRYGLSRAEFARVTRIGEASLARWESGALIQNGAHDQYLRLISLPENFERLRQGLEKAGVPPPQTSLRDWRPLSSPSTGRRRFRHLSNVEAHRERARAWLLRPVGAPAPRRELCTP
jgi:putative zinc finger/helix-turn-helix YgiT family protein